jgi:2'-5' RNA ligase
LTPAQHHATFPVCSLSVIEMEQLFLFGAPPRELSDRDSRGKPAVSGPRRDPLIFVIRPAGSALAGIEAQCAALQAQHGLGHGFIGADRLHITLQFVSWEREAVHRFLPQAEAIVSRLPLAPFEVSLTEALSCQSGRRGHPLVLGGENPAIEALCRGLGDAMRHLGLGSFVKRSVTPHLTLLYDPKLVPAQPIEPISWRATELTLIHSVQGHSRHDVLARWPLS